MPPVKKRTALTTMLLMYSQANGLGKAMATAIEVRHLRKIFRTHERGAGLLDAAKSLFFRKYKTIHALKNVSLKVSEGEILGLIGPNGAGKSTLIKAMCGTLFPTSGSVNCLGFEPWRERVKYVANIGAVFGPKSLLWWDLPAIDTFEFLRELYDVPKEEFGKRLKKIITLLDIADVSKKPVRDLSLGERMKCNLACALLHNPKLVFLDEPTIGVDLVSKDKIRKYILEVNKEFGTTFVITTHDMTDIENLCKRIVIINKGEIIYDGLLEKIKSRYVKTKHLKVKLASPGKKFLLAGCKVELQNDYALTIEINLRNVSIESVVQYLLKNFKAADITITNPPIEEIIKEIYRK